MARRMKIGVQLPEVERYVAWPEVREMAVTAEAVGFDSLWVGDHLLYRSEQETVGPWEAWSMLAAIAAVTERVQIGPLVAATSFHNPAMLAKKAVTVDEISNGRLILGLGAGWNRTEYDAYGFAFDHRASRFEEAFTIIRTLLSDGAIDFAGEYYTLRDCELVPPARPGGIPLMVGSEGPRVLKATLPHVDAWNAWFAWFGNTPDGAGESIAAMEAVCREVGRDSAEVAKTVTVLVSAPGGSSEPQGSLNRRKAYPIGGTHEAIAEKLVAFSRVGVTHVQLVVDPITAPSIEWLGDVLAAVDGA